MEVKFVELKQKHVEAFCTELPEKKSTSAPVQNGAIVRAAVKAGFFVSPKITNVQSVDDMSPADVSALALAIVNEVQRVLEVSPS